MAAIFAFTCSSCGDIHEGSPSFAFSVPDQYHNLSNAQRAAMGQLTEDACIISYDDKAEYFIRAVLEVPIHGIGDPFLWGIWVSVSERSFKQYKETYHDQVGGLGFFGWVNNEISGYPFAHARASDVVTQAGGNRPKVTLHHRDLDDDPLAIDQAQGISVAKAQALAERSYHANTPTITIEAPTL